MVEGFRIKAVTVEGFKGFMKPKEIDFDGDHVFLLGKNGNGKSSIIEAIRWGLFGSARRPNEIVANWDYTGRCRVEIKLLKEGKLWDLRRTLIRGASGGSDPVLTDEKGKVHPVGEIMPQLDSVYAGEGMHIIFAAQSSPLRRQPEDLTSFERTVFNHLGLSHPRALLSQVDNFLGKQEAIEDSLGEQITDARKELDDQIATFTQRRSNILNSSPWDSVHPPTMAQSQNKARQLITEITLESPDESLAGASLDALIDSAQTDLANRSSQGQDSLKNALAGIQERIDRWMCFSPFWRKSIQSSPNSKKREYSCLRLWEKCLLKTSVVQPTNPDRRRIPPSYGVRWSRARSPCSTATKANRCLAQFAKLSILGKTWSQLFDILQRNFPTIQTLPYSNWSTR